MISDSIFAIIKCRSKSGHLLQLQGILALMLLFIIFVTQDLYHQAQPRMLLEQHPAPITWHFQATHTRECFYMHRHIHSNNFTSRICELPNNLTVNIAQKISSGRSATIYLTEIYAPSQDESNDTNIYAMKHGRSSSSCRNMRTEYNFMKSLYSDNKTKINTPSVHPTIPYFRFRRHKHHSHRYSQACFFFMEYIANTNTLPHFFLSQTPQSLNEIDGGIIRFVLNCYDDIMSAVYRIYHQFNAFHNDLHERNVLVNKDTHKCFLIDFEKMFYLDELYENQQEFKCKTWKCSATATYSIAANDTRHHIRAKYLNEGYTEEEILDGFAQVAMFDMKYKVLSMLIHLMISNPMIIGNQSSHVSQLNDVILNESADGEMTLLWCNRLKLLNYLNINELEKNDLYKQKLSKLLKVFDNDRKSMEGMNVTCS